MGIALEIKAKASLPGSEQTTVQSCQSRVKLWAGICYRATGRKTPTTTTHKPAVTGGQTAQHVNMKNRLLQVNYRRLDLEVCACNASTQKAE